MGILFARMCKIKAGDLSVNGKAVESAGWDSEHAPGGNILIEVGRFALCGSLLSLFLTVTTSFKFSPF